MNQTGQSNSVFKLIIFAVIALALIYAAINFFPKTESDNIKELRQLLLSAKGNEGKTISKKLFLEKDLAIDAAKIFDDQTTSVSFSCNTPQCNNGDLIVDERKFISTKTTQLDVHARCQLGTNLYGCKLFFGLKPQQVEITKIELPTQIDLANNNSTALIEIENTGQLTAINVKTTIKVYKKTILNGAENLQLYAPEEIEFTESLEPQEKKATQIPLLIMDNGDYLLEVNVEGLDAGKDKKTFEFSASNAQAFSNCVATTSDQAFYSESEGKCITKYFCQECEFAFECQVAWQEKEPIENFESASREYALTAKEPLNGQC